MSDTSQRSSTRRALLSVSDKTGIAELARGLAELGVEIVSTGSTAATIREAGVEVREVADVTGFPEMMDGRVKTLHPVVHAGILADRSKPSHMEELAAQGIAPIDLVVVNLYPFERTVSSGAGDEQIIEQIDIGGPTLVRAAAKNFRSVAVVVSPSRYQELLDALRKEELNEERRRALAAEAFEHVASYDAAISGWFSNEFNDEPPPSITLSFVHVEELRYGENPHQRAALYRQPLSPGALGKAEVLQGKEMSYNNWLDAEAARGLAVALDSPAAVIVKHHNPSGAAVARTAADAYRGAFDSDTVSAFGGVVAFNTDVDEEAATAMSEVFTEVVIAPGYSDAARARFAEKKNLRVVRASLPRQGGLELRLVGGGGGLIQDADVVTETRGDMKVVTKREPSEDEWADLLFAWTVAARVKSNAIVFASGKATVGVGAGQMSRVDSVHIASRKAGERSQGAVMASDAFFPFRDGIDQAAEAGIAAVIQPGGSVRDEEVIAAADEHGMAMVFTGRRHFRH
jgi:phosphoribosylaminoimidazolecarboxamide formyltransferase/IMP cyclohydrolase